MLGKEEKCSTDDGVIEVMTVTVARPVDCPKTVDEVVCAAFGTVKVWKEEKCSADDGMIEVITVTVAGPVAATVISSAYVVGRPFVDVIIKSGPSTPWFAV